MFAKNQGSVSLAIELLDSEEENSDEPADAEVKLSVIKSSFTFLCSSAFNPTMR